MAAPLILMLKPFISSEILVSRTFDNDDNSLISNINSSSRLKLILSLKTALVKSYYKIFRYLVFANFY